MVISEGEIVSSEWSIVNREWSIVNGDVRVSKRKFYQINF